MRKLSLLPGSVGDVLACAQHKPKRRAGVWKNLIVLPKRTRMENGECWGPGLVVGVLEWPTREIAEQKALDWLKVYEARRGLKLGRPKLLPPKFFPAK